LAGFASLGTGAATAGEIGVEPGLNPSVYHFRIGEVDAWSISDANLQLGEGLDLMWPREAHPAMVNCLEVHGVKPGPLPLYVNILVIKAGSEVILFDAGFGGPGDARLGWLKRGLRQIGIAPEAVTAGFLSHAHADHLNGFVAGGKPAFPNAALHLLGEELSFWRSSKPDFSKSKRDKKALPNMIAEVRRNFEIMSPQTRIVRDGDELFDGLVRVEAAPGHTAGHACFRIRSGDDELLHLMDLAHHHLLMFADPTWTIAFDHDPKQSVVTRQKYWKSAAGKHTRCFGFHLPWPGLGRIVSVGEGYQWCAEPWSWQV
jgi:glyoxylase-like metal-dependent hydrolase (beta-lactamase superfamily II)